jgi:hypothetical protein
MYSNGLLRNKDISIGGGFAMKKSLHCGGNNMNNGAEDKFPVH